MEDRRNKKQGKKDKIKSYDNRKMAADKRGAGEIAGLANIGRGLVLMMMQKGKAAGTDKKGQQYDHQ